MVCGQRNIFLIKRVYLIQQPIKDGQAVWRAIKVIGGKASLLLKMIQIELIFRFFVFRFNLPELSKTKFHFYFFKNTYTHTNDFEIYR